jgi:hypothetical protein
VAIKVLNNLHPITSQQDRLAKEVEVLRACRHPHIVAVIHMCHYIVSNSCYGVPTPHPSWGDFTLPVACS